MQSMKLNLPKKVYHDSQIDETEYSSNVYERLKKIELFDRMRKEGCSIQTSCKALKTSKSVIYRWKKNYKIYGLLGLEDKNKRPHKVRNNVWQAHIIQKILSLRKSNPLYGKNKIAILLRRDHSLTVSISTVGRIISYLIKRDQIKPVSFYYKKSRTRPRLFNKHAKRWTRDMKSKNPGELFQIDHMTVSLTSDFRIKHFQGICPVTKIAVKQAYNRATSNIAKQFLEFVQLSLPFKLKSIQVDGGSEFMKEFEQACQDLNLPLYVLPPRSPEYNGVVERTNGSSRYEFYGLYDGDLNLFSVRKSLQKYVKKYNSYRPHQALQYLTPQQYFYKISGALKNSHIY